MSSAASSAPSNTLAAPSKATISREPLGYRKLLILTVETVLIVVAYYGSFLLRFENAFTPNVRHVFLSTLPLVLAIKLAVFAYFGLFSGWWRYVGMSDLLDISRASATSSCLLFFIEILLRRQTPPPTYWGRTGLFSVSVIVIDFGLTLLLLGGARFAVRAYTEHAQSCAAQKTTLIIGAGQAGNAIVRELKRNPDLDYRPVGFVDDDPSKRGIKLHGVPVLGPTSLLPRFIAEHDVSCVLIAIPSAKSRQMEHIVRLCRESKVELKTLPSVSERINGSASMREMRNVRVQDLLGRDPVRLDVEAIACKLQQKTVLVTGAGGSIGSELVRQLAKFNPRKLVFFERSENDLFKLCTEFEVSFPQTEYAAIVGDILDVGHLREVFALHRPDSIFHAAAYKHVPMMETNCFQAVTNNIFGTYNVALVAKQFQVGDFVMISSDKAVRPTNIMGVTKRVAELIMLGLQRQHTRFVVVRFGNVLGSNGSVVPLFEQQIAAGGPVTVTHPEATRYFMTIPEAAQLVLQASSMGKGGEIFLLDMGQPMKIVELAENLIRLSGLEPGRDIPIAFTGLRPGEKLFEELVLDGEGVKPTQHRAIRVLDGGRPRFEQVNAWLEDLSSLVEAKSVSGLIEKLREIVPEYTPSSDILSMCEFDRHDRVLIYRRARADLSRLATQDAA